MGEMIDGAWHAGWYPPDAEGRFRRPPTRFHGRVARDGSTRFAPESGRYHLYVSYACPWASRVIIGRALRRLEEDISLTNVDPRMGDEGWSFGGDQGDADPLHHARFLREVYVRADPRYTGRVTVPLLWDKREKTIVNNESRELLRMLSTEFADFGDPEVNLAPEPLRADIDELIEEMYEPINNGVYRAGFAGSQRAYETACHELFDALDDFDQLLADRRYLLGNQITDADICLYTTLVRFDLVYYSHFKCNLRRIQDYPHLWGYTRDLYQTPGFREATRLDQIKTHYYWSQTTVNPSRIVPVGPTMPLDEPHDRARFAEAAQPSLH